MLVNILQILMVVIVNYLQKMMVRTINLVFLIFEENVNLIKCFMQNHIIRTPRLSLKIFTVAQLQSVFDTNDKQLIIATMGYAIEAKYQKELAKYQQGFINGKRPFLFFQIIKKETNEIIGGCGFHNWILEHRRAEIGYDLYKDEYKQQGFMSEAIPTVIDYGFREMKLNRIEACVYKDNMASLAIIKKNNFEYEGNLRQHYFNDDQCTDSMLFSLLKEDY
jgi:[ribosomal protein S5]-alanine N-acetyltransferase